MGQSTNAILFYGYCWDAERRCLWNPDEDEEDEGDDDDYEDDDDEEEDEEDYDDEDDEDEGDWEKRYAALKGVREPNEEYPDKGIDPKTGQYRKDYNAEEQKTVDSYRKYFDAKHKLVEKEPCEIDSHCSCDCPMPFVAIKKSKTISWRGSMNEIVSLDVDPKWNQQLNDFCKLMKIKVGNKKPKWWLVSMWC